MEWLAVDGFQDPDSITISVPTTLPSPPDDDGKGLTQAHQLVSSWLEGTQEYPTQDHKKFRRCEVQVNVDKRMDTSPS